MTAPPDRLRSYLVPDEPLQSVHAATLTENSTRTPMSVAVTDRRLIGVAEDETVLSVTYDSIVGIRSHSRSRLTVRGNDYRAWVGCGSVLAVACLLGLVALSAGPLPPALAALSVGGLASLAYLWRTPDPPEIPPAPEVEAYVDVPPAIREEFAGLYRLRQRASEVATDVDDRRALAVAAGAVAVMGGFGVLATASSLLVVPTLLGLYGGVALIAYGLDNRDEFDGVETVRRREREIQINTEDGRAVHLRSDPSAAIDRDLSRHAFDAGPEAESERTVPPLSERTAP